MIHKEIDKFVKDSAQNHKDILEFHHKQVLQEYSELMLDALLSQYHKMN